MVDEIDRAGRRRETQAHLLSLAFGPAEPGIDDGVQARSDDVPGASHTPAVDGEEFNFFDMFRKVPTVESGK